MQSKNNNVSIHSDSVYQYFAFYQQGKLAGYSVRNKKGIELPLAITNFMVDKSKKYFILAGDNYLCVRPPEIKGLEFEGKAL